MWVVSGDYKVATDPTCAAFEPIRCHTFITESTFAEKSFQWPDQAKVWAEISAWWRLNRAWARASVLYCYAAGKSQRVLAGIDASLGHGCGRATGCDRRPTAPSIQGRGHHRIGKIVRGSAEVRRQGSLPGLHARLGLFACCGRPTPGATL